MKNLVAAIIYKAVFDWKNYPKMRDEIREFFRSKYGKELCETIDFNAKTILKKLEAMEV